MFSFFRHAFYLAHRSFSARAIFIRRWYYFRGHSVREGSGSPTSSSSTRRFTPSQSCDGRAIATTPGRYSEEDCTRNKMSLNNLLLLYRHTLSCYVPGAPFSGSLYRSFMIYYLYRVGRRALQLVRGEFISVSEVNSPDSLTSWKLSPD